ncbi:MAG: magnesium transporter CorA family protein [Kiritimatiellae bacterium]|nr:magnesium transporter CorA family protein [Kiritimatiellia bacterium]MDW8458595.1 magnesium transporter CorA family protein [Verrucomicrobiota bacterium]
MIRSFVFSNGKLVAQDPGLDFIRVMLIEEDAQIWIDMEQSTPEENRLLLEEVFNFHPLAIEDCVSVSEQPKVEEYEGYLFLVMHAVDYVASEHRFETHELNIFIGKNFLVSYHDRPLRSVAQTIDRVMKNAAAVARAPDRLTYTLLDFLLDSYNPAIERLSMEIAEMERNLLKTSGDDFLLHVLRLKAEVARLRSILSPQRDVIGRIARGEFKIIRSHLLPYFRDLHDTLVRLGHQADSYRDSLTNLMTLQINAQQNEINKVVKVLTVLATLALPIIVITSFYGMNLQHYPNEESHDWKGAYVYIFVLNAILTGIIYVILRFKRWM